MLLAIDVGNTATKVGLEAGSGHVEVLATLPTPAGQTLEQTLESAATQGAAAAAIACVVPSEADALGKALAALGLPYRFLGAANAPGIEIRYETPETLGADRLANAIAVSDLGRGRAVAVDFGTATKLDAIDDSGAYLGGAILPGAALMMRALTLGTAQLPEVPAAAPERAIGRHTAEALQSGTVLALAKAVEGLVAAFETELGGPARIVGTGGQSGAFQTLCPSIREWKPHLTLLGLLSAGRRWREAGWSGR